MAWVTTVARVQSLAQELLQAMGMGKKKKKQKQNPTLIISLYTHMSANDKHFMKKAYNQIKNKKFVKL